MAMLLIFGAGFLLGIALYIGVAISQFPSLIRQLLWPQSTPLIPPPTEARRWGIPTRPTKTPLPHWPPRRT